MVSVLGLETLQEKQEAQKRAVEVENELAKNEVLLQEIAKHGGILNGK